MLAHAHIAGVLMASVGAVACFALGPERAHDFFDRR
jgi:hypothetical protein